MSIVPKHLELKKQKPTSEEIEVPPSDTRLKGDISKITGISGATNSYFMNPLMQKKGDHSHLIDNNELNKLHDQLGKVEDLNNSIKIDDPPPEDDPQLKEKIKKLYSNEKHIKTVDHFPLGFLLKTMCCMKSLTRLQQEKAKVYSFSRNYVIERLDVIYYLKIINRVEKMKSIIFNSAQVLAFDYLKKPNLYNDEEREMSNIHLESDKELNAFKIVQYFKTNLADGNPLDLRMYDLLDPKLKALVHNQD
jgi:hypothetical protein